MNKNTLSIIALTLGLTVLPCSLITFRSSANSESSEQKNKKWVKDIETLSSGLSSKHPNLYYKISKENFDKEVEELKNNVPKMNEDEIKVGMHKIVASVADSHTRVYEKSETTYPIVTYCIKDDIYLIDTTEKYKDALYCKLVNINGKDMNNVKKELTSVIAFENDMQIKKRIPSIIMNPDMMYGLHITPDKQKIEITFERSDKTQFTMEIEAEKRKLGSKLLSQNVNQNKLPLYMKNPREKYWFEYLKDSKTLYLKYNVCQNNKEKPFEQFNKEVFKFIDNNNVEKFVIDIRNNSGGSDGIIRPLIDEIKKRDSINKKDKLYVIVGRDTFSSAIINAVQFKAETDATFVGECTSAKPDHFGSVDEFELPNSYISVTYSTKYCEVSKLYKCVTSEQNTFTPDVLIENNIDDFINNRDAVLESIIKDLKE